MAISLRSAAALLVIGAWLLAGCGGAAGASLAPAQTSRVEMPPSYRFEPKAIEVPVGTTVTWHNGDNFTHSVQIQGGEYRDLKPGETATITFAKSGTYDYVCTYHPQNMKGTVIVK